MTDRSYGCCEASLYRRNISMAIKYLAIFIVICIFDGILLSAIPAAFFIWNCIAIALLRRQFHRFGWPLPQENEAGAGSVGPSGRLEESEYDDIIVVRMGRQ